MSSPFEVLGVDPDADDDEIVQAYRRQVKAAHPDHGGSVDEFQRVKAAYEAIRDGEAKRLLDAAERAAVHEEEEAAATVSVEFLNYEVLDDYGWSMDDPDLFEKAAAANLDGVDYGEVTMDPNENLLRAVEREGHMWPFACRGGACANCAVAVVEGTVEMPSNHVLSSELLDRGVRLSCICTPTSEALKVVYNIKHLPGLDELRLPAQRFDRARPTR